MKGLSNYAACICWNELQVYCCTRGELLRGKWMGASKLLSRYFITWVESQIETWVTKLCRCTFLPGAMELGRIPRTMVGDVAFLTAFLRRNLQRYMPSFATDSQGLTKQQRKCLAFFLPDPRPVKWNLRRLTRRLWLPASPGTVWQQALAKEGRGSARKHEENHGASRQCSPGDSKRKLSNYVMSDGGQLAFEYRT